MTRGFVLGKFMPPHAGHVHLCETARALVDQLTILVCWLPDDPIPGPLRLQWMKALFPDCRVIGHDAIVPQAPAESPEFWPIWRGIVQAAHPEPIDIVFAGEGYGLHLAEELGATFTPVEPRLFSDLSGSVVRTDPWAHWPLIPHAVRPHYARTICLHGPESTGKSTLSAPLAAHFDTLWVPEYGRAHCELYGTDLDDAGLVTIGRTQSAMTRAALPWCNKRLIVDTDALTTAAWSLMILGRVPEGLFDNFAKADLYLLTDIDIPWEQDGGRYYPDPVDRQRFMDACVRVMEEAGVPWVKLSGPNERRLETAVAAVEALRP
ncbi:MAG TPA: AAA family ATPase [Allosphingosinicella sp.]|nr:AAA family ATPase [Allosphingosinicella sp.]